MAVTQTPRFGLTRWDSGADPFNREQNDSDNRQIDALGAVFRSGLDAGKGLATTAPNSRSFYYATDTETLYFSNGTVWVTLTSYSTGSDIQDLPVGTTNSPGSVTIADGVKTVKYALANHTHDVPDSDIPLAIGTANLEGTASTVALSDHVHEIGSGAIDTSGMFTAGVVNAAAIGTGAVVEAKIGSSAVTETKIGSSAVTETKIATDAVTPLKIASTLAGDGLGRNVSTGVLSVNVDGTTLETSGDTLRIKDNGVTTAKIGALQVTGAKIAAATITADKFAAGAVSGASLDDGAVIAQKIATDAVTTTKILDGNVTAVKLNSNVAGNGLASTLGVLSVNVDNSTIEINSDTLRIKDGGVTAVKLNSNVAGTGLTSTLGVLSVNVDNSTVELSGGNLRIKDDGVTTAKIDDEAVTEAKIDGEAVTAAKIGPNAVTAAKLHSGIAGTGINFASGVLSVKVDSTTIQHNGSGNLAIVAGGVDTTQIADDAVDYTKIDTGIYYNATTLGAGGAIKYSTSTPTGGTAGDIWLQYV